MPARLESLALLRDGWLDGQGVRLSSSGLGWLSKAWADSWPDEAPLPYVYPTPGGGVQLEWSSPRGSVTAEVNLDSRQADVLASHIVDGEVLEDAALSLAEANQWQALSALVVRQLKTEDRAA